MLCTTIVLINKKNCVTETQICLDLFFQLHSISFQSKSSTSPAQKSPGQTNRGKRVSTDTEKKATSKHEEPKNVPPKTLHPKIPNMENLQSDSLGFYQVCTSVIVCE